MRKARTWAITLGVVFVCTLAVGSARADAIQSSHLTEKFDFEEHLLSLPDTSRAPIVQLFAEDFENNNGRHLGFSVASVNRGNKFGLFRGPGGTVSSTTPNPEPAAVLLLGTGLAAVGAYARRRFKKPSR
jgi:hypothetical protein